MVPREVKPSEIAGAFVVRDPKWRSKIFVGGLLLLLVHPVGWPVALGYRKALIAHLSSGQDPLLPDWNRKIPYYFCEGMKAMGVIFGYLSPLYFALLLIILANGGTPDLTWLFTAIFFMIFIMLSTLSFPAIVSYQTFLSDKSHLSWPIAFLLLTCFAAIIFFIPAGFLQVSKSGRYLSAFNIAAASNTIRMHFVPYCIAWYRSAIMSFVGHLAFPFSPWGVFWCYLSIIYEFNSILTSERHDASPTDWFERLRKNEPLKVSSTSVPFVLRCLNPSDNIPCFMLKLGPTLIPLPRVISQCFKTEE